jgi:hypothetical protein
MGKRQPMRWSAEGAQLLQVRCAVLDNRLEMLFREWRPRFGRQTPPPLLLGCRPPTLKQSPTPKFAGKMNFYLSAVNDLLRHEDDQPSIGLILCKTRDRVVAEYSLRDVSKPIGVSEYQLAAALPEKLKGTLPTIEELENELSE